MPPSTKCRPSEGGKGGIPHPLSHPPCVQVSGGGIHGGTSHPHPAPPRAFPQDAYRTPARIGGKRRVTARVVCARVRGPPMFAAHPKTPHHEGDHHHDHHG